MIKIIVMIIFLFTASYNLILADGQKHSQSHIDDSELYNEATRYAGGMRSGTKDILRFLKPALWNTLTREEKQKVTEGIKNHSRETKITAKILKKAFGSLSPQEQKELLRKEHNIPVKKNHRR